MKFIINVSIPQWFDYNILIFNAGSMSWSKVSIPQWFDYNWAMIKFLMQSLRSQFHNGSITTRVVY